MRDQENLKLRNPWLVAAWPGMGHVAITAGSHLIHALKAEPAGMIPEQEFFTIDHVDVSNGIARSGRLPSNRFFVWRDPDRERDLLIFLGEAQPARDGYPLCQRVVDFALKQGVERVVTFAAMASQMHPARTPRVFGAVTAPRLLGDLREAGVKLLKEGQVGGLNGALLAAAAERGVGAMCLLGELPFYAASLVNPKSAHAVLDAFSYLTDLDIDLEPLARKGEEVQAQLVALLEQLKGQAARELGIDPDDIDAGDATGEEDEAGEIEEPAPLDAAAQRRIEDLFGAARDDRTRADELKRELDRLGVFEEYENRFLDLFRKVG